MNTTQISQRPTHRVASILAVSALALGLSACGKTEDPTVGQRLDSAVEKTEQAATDTRPAVTLTTFRGPRWNGPWFRRFGFVPMPAGQIGPGLAAVIALAAAAALLLPLMSRVLNSVTAEA